MEKILPLQTEVQVINESQELTRWVCSIVHEGVSHLESACIWTARSMLRIQVLTVGRDRKGPFKVFILQIREVKLKRHSVMHSVTHSTVTWRAKARVSTLQTLCASHCPGVSGTNLSNTMATKDTLYRWVKLRFRLQKLIAMHKNKYCEFSANVIWKHP